VLVGLGWDHAFEVCEEEIKNDMKDKLNWEPAVSKFLLALLLCSVVVPGWAFYILPTARKLNPEEEEEEEEDDESETEMRLC